MNPRLKPVLHPNRADVVDAGAEANEPGSPVLIRDRRSRDRSRTHSHSSRRVARAVIARESAGGFAVDEVVGGAVPAAATRRLHRPSVIRA